MRSFLFILALAGSSAALAQDDDNDNDGVPDASDNCPTVANADQTATRDAPYNTFGDACLHPSAVLGSGVVLEPGIVVGANVILQRGATVRAGAVVEADVVVGRSTTVGSGALLRTGVSLGYGVTVGEDTEVGARTVLGNLVELGDNAVIGSDVVIARAVIVEDNVQIGNNTVVGPGTSIGEGADIGAGVRIRKNTAIGQRAAIGDNARIGRDVVIEPGATIGEDANIGAAVTIGTFATLPDDTVIRRGTSVPQGDCSPALDGDSDGLLGCADSDCFSSRCPETCDDSLDNDADGFTDELDSDCFIDPEVCDNNSDDNGDGLIDCEDPLCATDPVCGESQCDDGVDNDGDSLIDCADDDCWGKNCHTTATAWVTGGELRMRRAYGIQYNQVDTSDTDCVTQSGSPGTSLPSDESFTIARFRANNVSGRVRVQIPTTYGSSIAATCEWTVTQAEAAGTESVERDVQRTGFEILNPANCRLGSDPATQSWFLPKRIRQSNTDSVAWSREADSALGGWYRGSSTLYDPTYQGGAPTPYSNTLPGYSFSGCPYTKERAGQQNASAFVLDYPGLYVNYGSAYTATP